ncbi:MAG: PilX N-terminal domain-containing pilus assembly protein [Ottowia sp.]|nr:hypothetical protein [Ottowia sp.]
MEIRNPPHLQRQQRGIVLVLALVFVVVISLAGLYAMRGSIIGEQVSKNIRANTVATQAAETALRYCEDEVRRGAMPASQVVELPVTLAAGSLPGHWQTRANWFSSTGAEPEGEGDGDGGDNGDEEAGDGPTATTTAFVEIPADKLAASGMRALPVAPRCMVERFKLPPAPGEPREAIATLYVYQITAVGFTADYERDDSTNRAKSGGESWLQSFLIL